MKNRLSCGLAVLTVLALLPRASALTVVQTSSQSAGNGISGTSAGTTWSYSQFDSSLGTLASVYLFSNITVVGTIIEHNHFEPKSWTSSVAGFGNWNVYHSGSVLLNKALSFSAIGPSETIPHDGFSRFTATFSFLLNKTLFSPAELADFIDGPNGSVITNFTLFPLAFYGSNVLSVATESTLTYNYYTPNTPDSGTTASMLGLSILVLLAVRRKLA